MNTPIDRKFRILAVNPANGKVYTEDNAFLICAKDKGAIAALVAYRGACLALGANPEHIASVDLLTGRVERYQAEVESRVPDTIGDELPRCIGGFLPERESLENS
jgi:hypothetical protein